MKTLLLVHGLIHYATVYGLLYVLVLHWYVCSAISHVHNVCAAKSNVANRSLESNPVVKQEADDCVWLLYYYGAIVAGLVWLALWVVLRLWSMSRLGFWLLVCKVLTDLLGGEDVWPFVPYGGESVEYWFQRLDVLLFIFKRNNGFV